MRRTDLSSVDLLVSGGAAVGTTIRLDVLVLPDSPLAATEPQLGDLDDLAARWADEAGPLDAALLGTVTEKRTS